MSTLFDDADDIKPKKLVTEKRNFLVRNVSQAKEITNNWLKDIDLSKVIELGLPEIDDRYNIWRVPLLKISTNIKIGEVVIDGFTTEILLEKTTKPNMLEARILGKDELNLKKTNKNVPYVVSNLRNTVGLGDSASLIENMPTAIVDLIFTSPPYFNARPEYSDYEVYEEYLLKMRQIIKRCHRVLKEGKFFVMNCSHVLIRRANRNESSKRIAVPFDLHRIFIEEGFEFVDDIIWVKPEGAGWATGRGRRFAKDRNPMQYKTVPVTEYVLVFRKKSDLLIDWFIKNHPNQDVVEKSKIEDDYEKTNIWKIHPKTNSKHPAPFPLELAQKVIKYYSFIGDVVMDPFAGSGTVGVACTLLKRKFVLYEINKDYIPLIEDELNKTELDITKDVLWINIPTPENSKKLF